MKKILLAIAVIVLIVVPVGRTIYYFAMLPKIGEEIPAFNFTYVAGTSAPAGKLTLIEFWATWCGPCIEGIPKINRLQADYGSRGLGIIAISEEEREVVESFVKRRKMNFPTAIDNGGALHQALRVESIPFAVLIDENRKIIWRGNPSSIDKSLIESKLAPKESANKGVI
jgi:cytochrome c biogenesis protein CcmG, thiol:disulfide interchange protein DsbE